jgi:hypothetical protein
MLFEYQSMAPRVQRGGKRIASASLDGTVKTWKTPSLQESTEVAEK